MQRTTQLGDTLIKTSPLQIASVYEKLDWIKAFANDLLVESQSFVIPDQIARDVQVVHAVKLPPKKGLSYQEGQARAIHDLASIELQAFELAVRTLIEFPHAPVEFREQLLAIAISEAEHFQLCLENLDRLGFSWGSWEVHTGLWQSVSPKDSLLDRILIVHRYLEGSGLDAGETLLKRIYSMPGIGFEPLIKKIVSEEVDHVKFGSDWYRKICELENIDPEVDFKNRYRDILVRVPKRLEPLSYNLRLQAGFSMSELETIEFYRTQMMGKKPS